MPERGEIVVYRNDRSIVLYSRAGQVRALTVNGDDVTSFSDGPPGSVCPFCGSVLPADKYDFVAKAYFNLLQSSFQGAAAPGGAAGISSLPDEPSDAPPGATGPIDATVPIGATVAKNIPSHLLVTGYYARFFVEGRRLGSGSFGHVFSCVHIMDDLVLGEFAVKKLPIGDDMGWLRAAIREIKVRENIRHRNVVDYNHSWLEMYALNAMAPVVPYLFILMEYCNGGDLDEFVKWAYGASGAPTGPRRLQDEVPCGDDAGAAGAPRGADDGETAADGPEGPLADAEVMAILCDIVAGLDHLHRNFIVHRDLKPSNILLKFARNGAAALISDFGTCEIFSQRSATGFTGTIEFTAPELLGAGGAAATHKADMWSLGVILHYVAYGRLPFAAPDMRDCAMLIRTADVMLPAAPPRAPLITSLITNLLSKAPDERPDCADILGDPEVAKYSADGADNERTRRSLYKRFVRYRNVT